MDHMKNWQGDPLAVKSDPDRGKKVNLLPGQDFFIFLETPESNLPRLVNQNPANRKPSEYMMAWLLLNKDVEMLVDNVRLMKTWDTRGYPDT
ncbi:MAG: hypothetical protein IPI69_10240 [Bacteroidales bacterium]|nr:hypothetical protein [Bacteroidales bacterium]